jgi:threonine dehydratase
MLSGCAIIAKDINPAIRIFGVEPELANDYYLSLRAGKKVRVNASETIADGLRTPEPGDLTFPVVQKLVEDVILVSEEEIKAAMRFALTRLKIVVEPSGAVCLAAALAGKLPQGMGPGGPAKVGLVISGGNVDLVALARLV